VLEDSTSTRVQRKKISKQKAQVPCVLTIAGSDSGGGAGIQADLKTFASIGVHGTSAITCITAQNPAEVREVQSVLPQIIRAQVEAILGELSPKAIKTGMLFSKAIIEVVEKVVPKGVPLIVDPVMVSTSGAVLLEKNAMDPLKRLFKRALLVTPNLNEAELLLDRQINNVEELRRAARDFHERFGVAALMKGGHLRGLRVAIDCLYDGTSEWLYEAPYIRGVSTHGTGCTYSAAIAAYLARGMKLSDSIRHAKEFISNAIASSYKTCGHFVLDTEWNRK